jgi:GNAT superfamily N-acetyltransferase
VLTDRLAELLASERITVLLAGDGPDGVAQLRFYPSIWTLADDAVLEELFVVPPLRGGGIGRALMDAAIDLARERGAAVMEVGTSESDTAAIALYESSGFTNTEGGPDGPRMLYLECDLRRAHPRPA